MWHSRHLDLDRNRDLLLDLLRGTSRPLRNDGHVVVRDVGIGLHRQVVKRDNSPTEQQDGSGQHHELVVQGKIYEGADHFLFTGSFPLLTADRACPRTGLRAFDSPLLSKHVVQDQGVCDDLLARFETGFDLLHTCVVWQEFSTDNFHAAKFLVGGGNEDKIAIVHVQHG